MAGTGGGISSIPLSVVGGVCIGWDGPESAEDGFFVFQGRRVVTTGSLVRRPGTLESSEVLLLAPVGSECAKDGLLNLLDKRAKGMTKDCTGYDR